MFRIYHAQYTTSGTLALRSANPPLALLQNNPISVDSGSQVVTIRHDNHGFIYGNRVTLSGLDSATSYGGISGASLNGTHTILAVDETGYTVNVGDSATGSFATGGTSVIAEQNAMYDAFVPMITTLNPIDTTISSTLTTVSGASFGKLRNDAGHLSRD